MLGIEYTTLMVHYEKIRRAGDAPWVFAQGLSRLHEDQKEDLVGVTPPTYDILSSLPKSDSIPNMSLGAQERSEG